MMKQYLNTLYVTHDRAYLHLDHETIRMEIDSETAFRMPLLHIGCIVCIGNVLVSPSLLHTCADSGCSFVFLDRNGRFKARLEGPVQGNVFLRQLQHRAVENEEHTLTLARLFTVGKVQNCRQVLQRSSRDTDQEESKQILQKATSIQEQVIKKLAHVTDIDTMRGYEGEAALAYFQAFDTMIRRDREHFSFLRRTRRPPLDRINALLSFIYTLLRTDCVSALESVGLDPQVGFLHVLRPGRPALALDLMEEFRAILADRLALSLVNRAQIQENDFTLHPVEAVYLSTEGRKKVLAAYQHRKKDEIYHPVLQTRIEIGLLPQIQARLLARHLRGDIPQYFPFLYR